MRRMNFENVPANEKTAMGQFDELRADYEFIGNSMIVEVEDAELDPNYRKTELQP